MNIRMALLLLCAHLSALAQDPAAEPEASTPSPQAEGSSSDGSGESESPNTTPPSPSNLSTSEVYAATRDSVVLVKTAEGSGAGFLVQSARLVATAFHVIAGGGEIEVKLRSGESVKASLHAYDEDNDLAVLRLQDALPSARPLKLAAPQSLTVGAPVVVIGHPFNQASEDNDRLRGLLTWTATAGVIGAFSDTVIQTDAAINPGNSGGPVLDHLGQVIGIVSSQLKDASNVGFAIRVEHLSALLEHTDAMAPLVQGPLKLLGMSLGLMRSEYSLNLTEFNFYQETRPREGRGLRRSVGVGYSWVTDTPETSQLASYHEHQTWVQLDFGYALGWLKADVLGGLRGGWRRQRRVTATAYQPPGECPLSQGCALEVTFEQSEHPAFTGFAFVGLKFARLMDTLDLGGAIAASPLYGAELRWMLWLSLMSKDD